MELWRITPSFPQLRRTVSRAASFHLQVIDEYARVFIPRSLLSKFIDILHLYDSI
jgi:hypothetical protein